MPDPQSDNPKMSLPDYVQASRQKFPDDFKDWDDGQVARGMLARYPGDAEDVEADPRQVFGNRTDALTEFYSRKNGVDPELTRRVIGTESTGKPGATSPKGAQGLMQVMPGTFQTMKQKYSIAGNDPYDLHSNLDAGTHYLREQLDEFGKPDLALAAYNAGPGSVRRYKGIPPFRETKAYVPKILSGYQGTGYAEDFIPQVKAETAPQVAPATTPAAPLPSNIKALEFKARGGETINDLATRYNLTPGDILSMNGDVNLGTILRAGQVLKLPSRPLGSAMSGERAPLPEDVPASEPQTPLVQTVPQTTPQPTTQPTVPISTPVSAPLQGATVRPMRRRASAIDEADLKANAARISAPPAYGSRMAAVAPQLPTAQFVKSTGENRSGLENMELGARAIAGLPNDLPGADSLSTGKSLRVELQSDQQPTQDQLSDAAVKAMGATGVNEKYRQETRGRNIVTPNLSTEDLQYDPKTKTYSFMLDPLKQDYDVVNAYAKGGLAAAQEAATNARAEQQKAIAEMRQQRDFALKTLHDTFGVKPEDVSEANGAAAKGLADTALGLTHLLNNVSSNFRDPASVRNITRQTEETQGQIPEEKSFGGRAVRGVTGLISSLPEYGLLGATPGGAAVIAYMQNRHRGTGEAIKAALEIYAAGKVLHSVGGRTAEWNPVARQIAARGAAGTAGMAMSAIGGERDPVKIIEQGLPMAAMPIGKGRRSEPTPTRPLAESEPTPSMVAENEGTLNDPNVQAGIRNAREAVAQDVQGMSRRTGLATMGEQLQAKGVVPLSAQTESENPLEQIPSPAQVNSPESFKQNAPSAQVESGKEVEQPHFSNSQNRRQRNTKYGDKGEFVEGFKAENVSSTRDRVPTIEEGQTAEMVSPPDRAQSPQGIAAQAPLRPDVAEGLSGGAASQGQGEAVAATPAEAVGVKQAEPVPQGYTRFYRADSADAPSPQGKNWARDPEYASQKYGAGQISGNESIWYIDVPDKPFIDDEGQVPDTLSNDKLRVHGIEPQAKLFRRVQSPKQVAPQTEPPPEISDLTSRLKSEIGRRTAPEKIAETAPPVVESPQENLNARPTRNPTGRAQREGAEVRAPRPAVGKTTQGRETTIEVPDINRTYPARYAVRELEDVVPSHNPFNFNRNEKYFYENDRDYTDPRNKGRVEQRSRQFKPQLIVNDNPDLANGPSVIDSSGNVLGGNNRAMILARVYRGNSEGAKEYRKLLIEKAAQFGLNPREIAGMRQPVLVREMDTGSQDVQRAITDFNVQPGAQLTGSERAISTSRRLPDSTFDFLSRRLDREGADGTLAQALEGSKGVEVVNQLIRDGVFDENERPRLIADNGTLTPSAKDDIQNLLLGKVFTDLEQLKHTPPDIKNKLTRAISPLTRLKGEWDITEYVRGAIDALQETKARKVELDDLNKTDSLFGESRKYTPEELAIAKVLQGNPRSVAQAFKDYAAAYDMEKSGGGLFGAPSRGGAFNNSFPVADSPRNLSRLSNQERAEYEQAKANIKSKLSSSNLKSSDPYGLGIFADLAPDLIKIGKYHAINGYREFKAWSEKMAQELGDGIKPYLANLWAHVQDEPKTEPERVEAFGQKHVESSNNFIDNPESQRIIGDIENGKSSIRAENRLRQIAKESRLDKPGQEKYAAEVINQAKTLSEQKSLSASDRPGESARGGRAESSTATRRTAEPSTAESTGAEPPKVGSAGAGDTRSIQPEDVTGGKVDVTRQEREARGLNPVERQAYLAAGDSYISGKQEVETGRIEPRGLAESVADNPRPLSAKETGALIYDRARLKNEQKAIYDDINKAVDAGDEKSATQGRERLQQNEKAFDANDKALELGGREWSMAGQARKTLVKSDYSIAEMIQSYKAETGKEPSPRVRAQIETQSKRIAELEKQIAQHEDQGKRSDAQDGLDRIKDEVAREGRRTRRASTRADLDTEFAQLSTQFSKHLETKLHANPLDPELVKIIGKMAKNRVLAGVNTIEGLVDAVHAQVKDYLDDKRAIRDAISGYGKEKQSKKVEEWQKTLNGLKSQMRDLSKQEDEASGLREKASLKAQKTRLQNSINEYERRIREGDYTPKTRRQAAYDKETLDLQTEMRKIKSDYESLKARDSKTPLRKGWDATMNALGLARALKTLAPLHASFRHTKMGLSRHPVLWAQSFAKSISALSTEKFDRLVTAMQQDPDYTLAKSSGLALTGEYGGRRSIAGREEEFQSDWIHKIPGIKHSDQSFTTMVNTMRFSWFKDYADNLRAVGLDPKKDAQAFKQGANLINAATGRGNLPLGLNSATPVLNQVFFSTRFLASRLKMLSIPFDPRSYLPETAGGLNRAAKVEGWKTLFGYTALVGSQLMLAKLAGAKVTANPDDSDFGKAVFGNLHLDLTAGMRSEIKFALNLGEAIASSGKKSAVDVVEQHLRNKEAPLAKFVHDTFLSKKTKEGQGTDSMGRPVYLTGKPGEGFWGRVRTSSAIEPFAPMMVEDAIEGYHAAGLAGEAASAASKMLGEGGEVYAPRNRQSFMNEQVAKEHQRLGLNIGESKQSKNESVETFQKRQTEVNPLVTSALDSLLRERRYGQLSDDEKKKVFADVVRRVRENDSAQRNASEPLMNRGKLNRDTPAEIIGKAFDALAERRAKVPQIVPFSRSLVNRPTQ